MILGERPKMMMPVRSARTIFGIVAGTTHLLNVNEDEEEEISVESARVWKQVVPWKLSLFLTLFNFRRV